jgi:peptidoglycan glycosyltransferase
MSNRAVRPNPPIDLAQRQRRRLRNGFALGLTLGIAWVAFGDTGRGEAAAHDPQRPPPVEPRIVSLRAAEARDGRPSSAHVQVVTPAREASPAWTIPAEALDADAAVLEDGRLVHLLPDGTRVELTLDPFLQHMARETLARYRVAQGAIVVMRPSTGEILALADHAEGRPEIRDIALQSASPAASVFKVISAAALLEHTNTRPDETICTHGGQNQLTLYHLKPSAKLDRKCETFAEALGSSNNVAFARLADARLKPAQLQATANRFLFNTTLPFHRAVGMSQARIPSTSRLGFARTAAGFESSTLSPLHAAMLTAAVGNGGVMMSPHLVRSARKGEATLFEAKPSPLQRVLAPEHARTLVHMLEATVTTGTGRKFFERKGVSRLGDVRAGGKSGSLSGRTEDGKLHYSWFVALAPIDPETGLADIAVAALVVQGEQWTVKGAVLARDILEAEMSRRARAADAQPPR